MRKEVIQIGYKFSCFPENFIKQQSSRKHTGPKTEASEFEVGSVKIENKKSDWLLVFIKLFMVYFRGPVKIIGGQ